MSETNENQNARPTFLTVLCILTFIGSGLGVLGGLLGLIGSSALAMFAPVGNSMLITILTLGSSVLCLFGAIKMWGLSKQGFMLYLAGSSLAIILSIVNAIIINSAVSSISSASSAFGGEYSQVSNTFSNAASTAVWSGVIFGIVINVVFILLYNANRKHLVN